MTQRLWDAADLQKSIRAVESVGAEVQADSENAIADRDRVQSLRRANLRAARQTVEQRKLQIIIDIRRGAAISQAPLVSEAARLGACSRGAQRHRENYHEERKGFPEA